MGPMDFSNLFDKVTQGFEAFTAHASDMASRVGSLEAALDSALKRLAAIETQVAPVLSAIDPTAAPIAAGIEAATKAVDTLIETVAKPEAQSGATS